MFSVLLSVALTGAQAAPAYYPYRSGYGGYGRYGSFCDGYVDCDPSGTWCNVPCLPMAFYPCIDCGSNKKEQEAIDKKINDLKFVLGKVEQKVLGLEEKLDILAKQHGEVQATVARQEDRTKNMMLEERLATTERFRAIEVKIEEKFSTGLSKLEERLRGLEIRMGGKRKTGEGSDVAALEQKVNSLEQMIKNYISGKVDINIKTAGTGGDLRRDILKRALVIVQCPADSKLYLDNLLTTGGTNLRTFYTPELEAGVNYFYTLRVELPRNGQIVTETQRVYFQAGREVRVSFEHLSPDASQRVEKR